MTCSRFGLLVAVLWAAGCGGGSAAQGGVSPTAGRPELLVAPGVRVTAVGQPLHCATSAVMFVSAARRANLLCDGALAGVERANRISLPFALAPVGAVSLVDGSVVIVGAEQLAVVSARGMLSPFPHAQTFVGASPATGYSFYAFGEHDVYLVHANGSMRAIAQSRVAVRSVGGTGDLTFIGRADGRLLALRLGAAPVVVGGLRAAIESIAVDPSGYVVVADDVGVYVVLGHEFYPVLLGIQHPRLAATSDGVFVRGLHGDQVYRIRNLVALEQSVSRAGH